MTDEDDMSDDRGTYAVEYDHPVVFSGADMQAEIDRLKAALAASEAARGRAEALLVKLTGFIWSMQDQGAEVPSDPRVTDEERDLLRLLDAAGLDALASPEPAASIAPVPPVIRPVPDRTPPPEGAGGGA